jgi:hypothetical protein
MGDEQRRRLSEAYDRAMDIERQDIEDERRKDAEEMAGRVDMLEEVIAERGGAAGRE